MENLQRRASGIYVARLTVPERLRHLVGRREFITSTGTSQLAIAKLVAGAVLARWRQQLFELERLALAGDSMNYESIIKIAEGHPLLADARRRSGRLRSRVAHRRERHAPLSQLCAPQRPAYLPGRG